jgi:hypothetical protein
LRRWVDRMTKPPHELLSRTTRSTMSARSRHHPDWPSLQLDYPSIHRDEQLHQPWVDGAQVAQDPLKPLDSGHPPPTDSCHCLWELQVQVNPPRASLSVML